MKISRIGVLLLGLVSGALVAADDTGLTLTGAWVRALPPGQSNTAAYLQLGNSSDAPLQITGASCDISALVEIHTTREVDGYQRMEQLQELTLAPGQQLELAPGGTHLMLLDLERMPAAGEQVRLCLALASGQQACTNAEVRRDSGQQSHQHHHQH